MLIFCSIKKIKPVYVHILKKSSICLIKKYNFASSEKKNPAYVHILKMSPFAPLEEKHQHMSTLRKCQHMPHQKKKLISHILAFLVFVLTAPGQTGRVIAALE